MCFVRISEQTATFALQNIRRLVFITEVESVYSAVRTESLYKTDTLRLQRVNFFKESRPALGPAQPPFQWVQGYISKVVKLTTHLYLACISALN
jgi:hypothetical protein